MSKAFTRESDDLPERPEPPRQASVLPSGAKNYLTESGERRLRSELDQLVQVERPHLAAVPEDNEVKRRLQLMDQRILRIRQSLSSAVVVPPPSATEECVRFGATVTVRESSGEESRYRIVGVDEISLGTASDEGGEETAESVQPISWLSPIARALTNARLGQRIRVKLPGGEQEMEVVGVTYEEA
jgi:transcription elongation factor GreB